MLYHVIESSGQSEDHGWSADMQTSKSILCMPFILHAASQADATWA